MSLRIGLQFGNVNEALRRVALLATVEWRPPLLRAHCELSNKQQTIKIQDIY